MRADYAPGLDEPLVDVLHAAIGVPTSQVEEPGEVLLPLVVGHQPRGGVVSGLFIIVLFSAWSSTELYRVIA